MTSFRGISIGTLICALAAGCVRTPMHDGITNVPVAEVVRRLKCELATAIDEKRHEDSRFYFLTQWAAKVHLTLVVDDSASINPGATFIEPLSVTNTNRSLAIGAGLTSQAVRTEDIEFFLSFNEMLGEMGTPQVWAETYNYCARGGPGILLESELGLKAVLDKALAPVSAGILYTGKNNPGLGGGQPKIPTGEVANIQKALASLDRIDRLPHQALTADELNSTAAGRLIREFNTKIQGFNEAKTPLNQAQTDEKKRLEDEQKTLTDNLAAAKQAEADTKLLIREVVTPLYEIATNSIANACQDSITADKFAATTSASVVAINKFAVDNAQDSKTSTEFLKKEQDAEKQTYKFASHMLQTIKTCGPKEKSKPALYDPLDIIGETVNFYVTATGSFTPSWKLVRIAAPLASTFVSGTRKDTNTLILVLGRPNSSGDGGPSKAMEQQILSQILSQAITVRIDR